MRKSFESTQHTPGHLDRNPMLRLISFRMFSCWILVLVFCLFVWGNLRGHVHFVGKLQDQGGFSFSPWVRISGGRKTKKRRSKGWGGTLACAFYVHPSAHPTPQLKPGPYVQPGGAAEGRGEQQGPPTSARQVIDSRGSELAGLRGHCLRALPEQRLCPLCPQGLVNRTLWSQ